MPKNSFIHIQILIFYVLNLHLTTVSDASRFIADKSHILSPYPPKLTREQFIFSVVMINPEILIKYGAKAIGLKKNQVLFHEGDEANFYYEVDEGSIKLVTYSEEGQEFIQSIFNDGDSFGEPPLFCRFNYPSSAIALTETVVWKLSRDNFFRLLQENFDIHIELDRVLCQRLKYKSMLLSEISFYDPEHRINSLLKYLKESNSNSNPIDENGYQVPLTRQQLADMSGLRVETVIRTVKKMEENGSLKLIGHKIYV
jgi:CRP/FNR family transcriptional regulator, cyclic AMP receptor protein